MILRKFLRGVFVNHGRKSASMLAAATGCDFDHSLRLDVAEFGLLEQAPRNR